LTSNIVSNKKTEIKFTGINVKSQGGSSGGWFYVNNWKGVMARSNLARLEATRFFQVRH